MVAIEQARLTDSVRSIVAPHRSDGGETGPPEVVSIGLLGPLTIHSQGSHRVVPGLVRSSLLALLAISPGRIVSTGMLIEQAWRGAPPKSAASALRVHLTYIRGLLDGGRGTRSRLIHTGSGYQLDEDRITTDALQFERLVRDAHCQEDLVAAVGKLRRALSLWRGTALPCMDDVPDLAREARRLQDLRLYAEEREAELRITLGDHVAACTSIRDLVDREPLRERRAAALMVALSRSGRQAEALAVARHLRCYLREELGCDPCRQIEQLETEILRNSPRLSWAPAPPAVFGG